DPDAPYSSPVAPPITCRFLRQREPIGPRPQVARARRSHELQPSRRQPVIVFAQQAAAPANNRAAMHNKTAGCTRSVQTRPGLASRHYFASAPCCAPERAISRTILCFAEVDNKRGMVDEW